MHAATWIIILVAALVSCFPHCLWPQQPCSNILLSDTFPEVAYVKVGKPFHFDCVLNQICFNEEDYDPSQVYFYTRDKNYTNDQLEMIDRYRFRLTIPNATFEHTGKDFFCQVCPDCKYRHLDCVSEVSVGCKYCSTLP